MHNESVKGEVRTGAKKANLTESSGNLWEGVGGDEDNELAFFMYYCIPEGDKMEQRQGGSNSRKLLKLRMSDGEITESTQSCQYRLIVTSDRKYLSMQPECIYINKSHY